VLIELVYTRWQWYCIKTQHKNTQSHDAQTRHNTQSYTSNKGHIRHNEYNTNKKYSSPRNRPWRPIVLWDVENPTLSIQSAHRWRLGCQPYTPATLYPSRSFIFWYSFLLQAEETPEPWCSWNDWIHHRLLARLMPTFEDRGCHVVSVTDPYGHIFHFPDRSRNLFFQVAPQLYSRG
jgi:hypothetical protein